MGGKHDADGERGYEGGAVAICDALFQNNLVPAPFSGSASRLRLDVLDFNGGIVDQYADRESQSTERHNVDGFVPHGA